MPWLASFWWLDEAYRRWELSLLSCFFCEGRSKSFLHALCLSFVAEYWELVSFSDWGRILDFIRSIMRRLALVFPGRGFTRYSLKFAMSFWRGSGYFIVSFCAWTWKWGEIQSVRIGCVFLEFEKKEEQFFSCPGEIFIFFEKLVAWGNFAWEVRS